MKSKKMEGLYCPYCFNSVVLIDQAEDRSDHFWCCFCKEEVEPTDSDYVKSSLIYEKERAGINDW